MPLAAGGFMAMLSGAGFALWTVRRRARVGQLATGQLRR
jgi:hypothetical protein